LRSTPHDGEFFFAPVLQIQRTSPNGTPQEDTPIVSVHALKRQVQEPERLSIATADTSNPYLSARPVFMGEEFRIDAQETLHPLRVIAIDRDAVSFTKYVTYLI